MSTKDAVKLLLYFDNNIDRINDLVITYKHLCEVETDENVFDMGLVQKSIRDQKLYIIKMLRTAIMKEGKK